MSGKIVQDYWEEFYEAMGQLERSQPWEREEYEFGPDAHLNSQFSRAIWALGALGELVGRATEILDSLQIIGWDSIAGTLDVSRRTAMRWREKLEREGVINYEKVGKQPQKRPIAPYLRLIAYKLSREKGSKKNTS